MAKENVIKNPHSKFFDHEKHAFRFSKNYDLIRYSVRE